MKVKVGDKIYDASEIPVMIIMDKEDKWYLENFPYDRANKYAAFPENWGTTEEMHHWTKD